MTDFLHVLHQVCGPEAWEPESESDTSYRMALLALALISLPPHLHRQSDRRHHRTCCICGYDTAMSLRESHRSTCVILLLSTPTRPDHAVHVRQYLYRVWEKVQTVVALEMEFKTIHVIMAHMRQYPDGGYRHAGALVDVLVDLEEAKVPAWNAAPLLTWIASLPHHLRAPRPGTPPTATPTTPSAPTSHHDVWTYRHLYKVCRDMSYMSHL